MIPSFVADGSITSITGMDDSIKLGQKMLDYKVMIQLRKDPGLMHTNEKIPKYVV